ncbi:MAG: 16S rRNA (cytosine(967)-C(5))-methyltransferase RsmB [Pseudomonadota bacterium]
MNQDPRLAAAKVIAAVLDGRSLNSCLPAALAAVQPEEKGLLQQLCYGTLRHIPRLQALLSLLLNKPLKRKDADLQGLLLSALYQLDSTRIPDHAAVDTAVSACRSLNKAWATGMVNAVLRRYLREREALTATLNEASRRCHPRWLHERIVAAWPQYAEAVLHANNERPPMTLRCHKGRVAREDYLARLAQEGVEATPGQWSEQALTLSRARDVDALPGFADGDVSVQDEAAQLAAVLLDAGAGERVFDVCAAPGGKSGHILERAPDLRELVAMDSDPDRLSMVEGNLQRLGLQATLINGDGREPPAILAKHSFDRILVDAPCSASGVIRRHPDIKVLRTPSDILGFARLQLDILQGVWPLLKPGGRLLYVTCSIFPDENTELVQRFLELTPGAAMLPIAAAWGLEQPCGRQLLPSAEGPDGLYFAALQRTS